MSLRRTRDLWEYTIAAVDADIGRVRDLYFDDETWTIRYIVVESGVILSRRKVLISPASLQERAWSPLHIRVKLTCGEVESSPSIDLHKPISRRHEIEHHKHYGWPYYWLGKGVWGSQAHPAALAKISKGTTAPASRPGIENPSKDAHLRSVREVMGYHVSAEDGEIGHVEDFLFDDHTWEIRYAIIDTKKWWAEQRVLLSPRWIKRVSWKSRGMYVGLSRELVRKSPKWDPDQPLNRRYELQLHKHYDFPPYWTELKQ